MVNELFLVLILARLLLVGHQAKYWEAWYAIDYPSEIHRKHRFTERFSELGDATQPVKLLNSLVGLRIDHRIDSMERSNHDNCLGY